MTTVLSENIGTLESATKVDEGIYEITILDETRGSSGTYLASAVESVPNAYKPNTISFFGHASEEELAGRNVRREAAGKILESWVTDNNGRKVAKGKYQVLPEHREFIEFFKDSIALSISAAGEGEKDSNTGEFLVSELDANYPFTSIDVVWRGGTGAKFNHHLESLDATKRKRIFESATTLGVDLEEAPVTSAVEEKEKGSILDEKILEAIQKQNELLESVLAERESKAQAEAEATVNAEQIQKAVEAYAEREAAIDKAELFESQKAKLREAAKRGEDVAPLIESELALAKEAREAVANELETGSFAEGKVDETDAKKLSESSLFAVKETK